MKKTLKTSKLRITTETVRALTTQDLGRVAGGYNPEGTAACTVAPWVCYSAHCGPVTQ
jgi:hypothetical protein